MLYRAGGRAAGITAVAALLALLALLCGLGIPAHGQALQSSLGSLQPEGWDRGIALAQVSDLNPDPHVVEVNLDARVAPVEIAPGQRVNAWTYNGGIPGPLIRVRAGDRLIVHFLNHLPQSTTVHWHGIRVPIQMD